MMSIVTNPLHLYRYLLRETTYLFDSNARDFFHKYVTASFRRHGMSSVLRSAANPLGGLPSKDESRRLKKGRKFLSLLERANNGHISAVEKVLRLTYARKGKRRRQLMSKIMTPELADPMAEDGGQITDISSRSWQPPRSFTALARAQARIQDHLGRTRGIKLSSNIPDKNRWGKPMPTCRIKNMQKKWYARNADLLLPPLPEKEWQTIYDMTFGRKTVGGQTVIPRRPLGTTGVLAPKASPGDAEASEAALRLAEGPRRNKFRKRKFPNPHKLTPRFLRRMTARTILKHTPLAIASGEQKDVAFRWEEGVVNRRLPKHINESQANSLFD